LSVQHYVSDRGHH